MGAIRQPRLPKEILTLGNSRMWLRIFKAMSRKEFLEYPQTVRNFDEMSMSEYYAWRNVRDSRDDIKLWTDVVRATEGMPAPEGTIQHGAEEYNMLQEAHYLEKLGGQKECGKIKAVNLKEKPKMLKAQRKDGKTVVTVLGKEYEVNGEASKIINGVNYQIAYPELSKTQKRVKKAAKKAAAKPEPKEKPAPEPKIPTQMSAPEPKAEEPAPEEPKEEAAE